MTVIMPESLQGRGLTMARRPFFNSFVFKVFMSFLPRLNRLKNCPPGDPVESFSAAHNHREAT